MFIYTAMNAKGTWLMIVLGLPFVAASLLAGLALQVSFSGAYLVALAAAPLVWSLLYTNALRWFNSMVPAKPVWQFIAGVVAADLIVVAGVIYAAA